MTHYISRENNKLVFKTNGLDRMTVDNDGNIGIGTTIPSSHLDINGSINYKNSYIRKTSNTNASVSSSGGVALPFNITETSFGSDITITSNTITTINTDGLYLVSVYINWSANSGGYREVWISHRNSSDTELRRYGDNLITSTGNTDERQHTVGIINCSATDRIIIYGYQSSGSSLNAPSGNSYNNLSIYRLGDGY